MKQLFTALLFIAVPLASWEQTDVTISEIREERSLDFGNKVMIRLDLDGLQLDEGSLIKLGTVTFAKDDLGNDLGQVESYFSDRYENSTTLEINIEAPPRSASRIVELKGEIMVFEPSVQNGSLVEVRDVFKRNGENLLKGKPGGVSVAYMDKRSIDQFKDEQSRDIEFKKDSLRKIDQLDTFEVEMVEALMGLFDGFFGETDDPNSLSFFVSDPGKKLANIIVKNPGGEIQDYGSFSSGGMRTLSFYEKPQPDWVFAFMIENDKAVKRVPFVLKDIILP